MSKDLRFLARRLFVAEKAVRCKSFLCTKPFFLLSGLLGAASGWLPWVRVGRASLGPDLLGAGPSWVALFAGIGLAVSAWRKGLGLTGCLFGCLAMSLGVQALGLAQALPSVDGVRLLVSSPETWQPVSALYQLDLHFAPGFWLGLLALLTGGYGLVRQRHRFQRDDGAPL